MNKKLRKTDYDQAMLDAARAILIKKAEIHTLEQISKLSFDEWVLYENDELAFQQ